MENKVQIFDNPEFGEVRVVMIDGEPWFVAADVCRILEIDKTQTRRLDDDEKGLYSIQTLGGEQDTVVVNEPGLYRLVFASRKPEAREFQRWVYHEVLPSIRKTGGYSVERETIAVEREKIAIEREKLALEREKFNVENSEATKSFTKVQLLRELASASKDEFFRYTLIKYAATLLTGEKFESKNNNEFEPPPRVRYVR